MADLPQDAADPAGGAPAPAPPADDAGAALLGPVEQVHLRLRELALPLEVPGAAQARAIREAAARQVDDYLLPRLRSAAAPLLVVVGGSTGAGKSTLVNSLLGATVTDPGVLRPTTRAPVLVHHPLDGAWFSGDRVLPGLARVTGSAPTAPAAEPRENRPTDRPTDRPPAPAVRLVPSEALPRGMALLDAPDVDSVEAANRALAAQLLAAADLWLFVTTAARYADAVPWELLHDAAARHAVVALVVDRVDPGAEAAVADLRRMLDEHGLAGAPSFALPEGLDADGLLPEAAVGELAAWLSDLGGDVGARQEVARATRDGAVAELVRRALALADAADAQVDTSARLRESVTRAYGEAGRQVAAATSDGALLRGEVLARWQELVGTGDLLRAVERGVGRLRDAVTGFLRGRPAPVPPVEQAIAHGLAAVVLDAADGAAERTHAAWRGDPAGEALLPDLGLSRSSASLRATVDAEVRAWQGDVLDLVREQGERRRGAARALSFGLNALGVSLMVVVFASTGGLTGVEVGIAGGTALVAQRLLEAVFGDDAVRRLTVAARERLDTRVSQLLAAEAERFTAQLDALGASSGDALRAAGLALQEAARRHVPGPPAPGADDDAALTRGARAAQAPGSGRVVLRGAAAWRAVAASPGRGGVGDGAPTGHPDGAAAAPSRPGFWRRLLGRGGAG
ncbi:GTPase domain-containing protein [Cellulomonas olei]|uniref:GTPase domain-containing protein n=1 Tax=Cellulomonas sp. P4 TaxID=3142533 RepID=UPI0031BB0D67